MRAGAFQPDVGVVLRERVDEHPVRFNMAVTIARKIASQRMVFQLRPARRRSPCPRPTSKHFLPD